MQAYEIENLVALLVSGLLVFGYHGLWIYNIVNNPNTTVPGIMGAARKVWLYNTVKSGKYIDVVQSVSSP